MGHVHGLARDPGSGDVLLATHGGLFRLDPGGPVPVGPVVDLMGFAIAPDGRYLGSGHPGAGVDLEQPVGLIRSDDMGASWTVLSRAGESDFHALTAAPGVVAGFDGSLRVGADGSSWQVRTIPAEPHTLAASPSGDRLLATTEKGLLASIDRGASWTRVTAPELLVAVTWAEPDTVVGVGVSGRLALSEDGGASWTQGERPVGRATALHATRTGGQVEVLLVVGDHVVRTLDLGRSLDRLL